MSEAIWSLKYCNYISKNNTTGTPLEPLEGTILSLYLRDSSIREVPFFLPIFSFRSSPSHSPRHTAPPTPRSPPRPSRNPRAHQHNLGVLPCPSSAMSPMGTFLKNCVHDIIKNQIFSLAYHICGIDAIVPMCTACHRHIIYFVTLVFFFNYRLLYNREHVVLFQHANTII